MMPATESPAVLGGKARIYGQSDIAHVTKLSHHWSRAFLALLLRFGKYFKIGSFFFKQGNGIIFRK